MILGNCIPIPFGKRSDAYQWDIINNFIADVIADGGTFEDAACMYQEIQHLLGQAYGGSNAYDEATLVLTANAWNTSIMYAVKRGVGLSDFPFARALAAYRVDSSGNLELMGNDVPRLTYDTSYNGCPAWLFEPARTNLILQSDTMSASPWALGSGGTGVNPVLLSSTELDPFGDNLACKYTFNAGAGLTSADRSFLVQTVTVLNATTYNSGFWARGENGGEQLVFRHVGASAYLLCNLTTEWQRFDVAELSTGTAVSYLIEIRQGTTNGTINASATVYLSGAHVEQGVKATSNIDTLGATVLRPADVSTRTDLQTGGYLGTESGSFYIDYENTSQSAASASKEIEVSGGAAVDAIQLQASTLSGSVYPLSFRKVVASVATVLFTPSYSPANIRALFVYDATTLSIYMNGVKVVDSTSFTRANNALDTFDILGGGLYRKAIRVVDFSDATPTDAQAEGATGFSSLDDYLLFIGYSSDDPSLYASYL